MIEVKVKETVKLSELPEGALLSYEDAHFTVSPSELRQRIADGESFEPHTWYVAVEQRWKADAKHMIERYIEDEYDNGMYEDWDNRAKDCLRPEHFERIQAVLDEAFKDDYATKYWMLDGPEVIID
ncbi:hypothetical protein RB620_04485 [Paenibacillus sp. LHD-117]|uniref:hypothetical protein n=1 Tax=Paenibacillus sp. LHD-117 TaxID=3071412 RepID=UPI0027DF9F35|nr:hypothetical protein [Paenibacillus sp. LHD-117]MDQ6418690.1 hypothetical protein [Paenibacillus sp. LHD-117]